MHGRYARIDIAKAFNIEEHHLSWLGIECTIRTLGDLMSKKPRKEKYKIKGQKKFPKVPPVEVSDGYTGTEDLMEAIAIFNSKNNALAAWDALRICIEHNRPLPEGISDFFKEISTALLKWTNEKPKDARSLIPNLILGIQYQDGGDSIFDNYRLTLRDRAAHKRLDAEMIQRLDRPNPETMTAIYDRVSLETNISAAELKRLFEEMQREEGDFSIRALTKAVKDFRSQSSRPMPVELGRDNAPSQTGAAETHFEKPNLQEFSTHFEGFLPNIRKS